LNTDEFARRYGPVAVVTGASSGIGRGFAELLAAKGLDLVLTARRQELLDELASQLKAAHGTTCRTLALDLSRPDAAETIAAGTADLDVGLLVSNAGFPITGNHAKVDGAELTEMVLVNALAPLQLSRLFIPRLAARGHGGIIFTSSVEGFIGFPFSAAYSATKGLVNSFGEALWAELKPHHIDVLTLCPGPTDTGAPVRVGIDIHQYPGVLTGAEAASVALDNITEGPTVISGGEFYVDMIDQLLAAPRREALLDLAEKFAHHADH